MLTPKRYNMLNCIENCIANICDMCEIDFSPLFLFSWDFGYDVSHKTIGERIHYHYNFDLGLSNYIEISRNYLNVNISRQLADKCHGKTPILSDGFYMVSIDSFDCNWNLAYQKYHYPHYFLLENWLREVIAVDSFSTLDKHTLSSEMLKAISGIYLISILDKSSNSVSSIENIYYNTVKSNVEKNVFGGIRKFASDLSMIIDVNDLSPQIDDVSNAYIVRRLSYITNSRYNTISLFRYLNFDVCYINAMNNIFILWESIKSLFIKILITQNRKYIEKVCDLILQVADEEMQLATNLLKGKYI